MRYLQKTYTKAKDWSKTTGAGIEDDEDILTVKAKIIKICPHYGKLSTIFHAEKEADVVTLESSATLGSNEETLAVDGDEEGVVFLSLYRQMKRHLKNHNQLQDHREVKILVNWRRNHHCQLF